MVKAGNEQEKMSKYDRYIDEIREDIAETVQQFGCQPILFVGSGLSRRYFGAPSWDELLLKLAEDCPLIEKGLGFYRQSFGTPLRIGEEFARLYQEWAWSAGYSSFPVNMFEDGVDAQEYIKFKISELMKALTPHNMDDLGSAHQKTEIIALQKIRPHAIITTNYDSMLEVVFPDYQPIIGQQILKGLQFSIGEIFKIHGCVSQHPSIVFTQSDYDFFLKKKKFLSAKLLTFFNEHPLVFIGYSANDPNIKAILSDIDEALLEKGGIIPNVYILQWRSDISTDTSPARDKIISTEEDRNVRVKLIEANDFSWVFDAFSANPALNDVNPRVLRALIARSYELVRYDIPKMKVHADFQMLTEAVSDSDAFAKLFGIANISDYSAVSAKYPYSATQLGKLLGGTSWHVAQKLIDKIKGSTGLGIKASDNKYHRTERINKTDFHKYSAEAALLLTKFRNGETVNIDVT